MVYSQVKVFTGKDFPSENKVDASFKNLIWENVPDHGKVKQDNSLAFTNRWGPLYWVSLDLIVHKAVPGWSSVFAFIAYEQDFSKFNQPSRTLGGGPGPGVLVPGIEIRKTSAGHYFYFSSYQDQRKRNQIHTFKHRVKLNKWYKIVLQQVSIDGKVRCNDNSC